MSSAIMVGSLGTPEDKKTGVDPNVNCGYDAVRGIFEESITANQSHCL